VSRGQHFVTSLPESHVAKQGTPGCGCFLGQICLHAPLIQSAPWGQTVQFPFASGPQACSVPPATHVPLVAVPLLQHVPAAPVVVHEHVMVPPHPSDWAPHFPARVGSLQVFGTQHTVWQVPACVDVVPQQVNPLQQLRPLVQSVPAGLQHVLSPGHSQSALEPPLRQQQSSECWMSLGSWPPPLPTIWQLLSWPYGQ
jgi:hypothetical protein